MKGINAFLSFALVILVLTACGTPEWEEERELGFAAESSGDIDGAIKHYKKALKLNGDYDDAKKDLERAKNLYYEASRERQKEIDEKRNDEEKEKNNIEAIININEVTEKTEDEINALLGDPSETEDGKIDLDGNELGYKLNYYKGNKINVIFINGRSTNIRVSLSEEEYLDGNDIEKNVQYIGLPIKDMSIDVALDGKMFASSYGYDYIYKVEISRWRGSPGGSVYIIVDEKYSF